MNTFSDDPCCSRPLAAALRSGVLDDVDSWTCPKCGCEWAPTMVDIVRHWEPRPIMQVW